MTDDFLVERGPLMAEGNRLRDEAFALRQADRWRAERARWRQVKEIAGRYELLLPEVPVARCPDTGALVRWPIDTAGLDGWFWRYEGPVRRPPTSRPPRWLAMTGAMRLAEPVEYTPDVVIPGPGVPFVVPRILNGPDVRAVIAQVPVGAHTGWPISYFGPRPRDTVLVNLWGTDTHMAYDDGTWRGWSHAFERASDYDFELGGWLDSGKLLWIAPGDDSATLREGRDGCPYLDLPGERRIANVWRGEVRYSD
jgi:hypothetical protein